MKSYLSAFVFAVSLCATVNAEPFGLDPSRKQDTVYFHSAAKLELIDGATVDLTGGFTVDPQHASQGAIGLLRCDLRTLKTGIDTRDEHMRDRYLQTKDYPYAFFQLAKVGGLPDTLKEGQTYTSQGEGWFYIHGHKRLTTATLHVTRQDRGDARAVKVRAEFEVKLDDYAIERPKAVFMKLAESIVVEAVFSGSTNMVPSQTSLPDWPELR
jgi:polyisoprenoid-binding protein YceI